MPEELTRRVPQARCQHCPEVIEQDGESWIAKRTRNLSCDGATIKHKPMPRILEAT